jgi:hypothetical protein
MARFSMALHPAVKHSASSIKELASPGHSSTTGSRFKIFRKTFRAVDMTTLIETKLTIVVGFDIENESQF